MKYQEIDIGMKFSFEREIKYEDVRNFGLLVGDKNKMHISNELGKKSEKGVIAHGLFIGSFIAPLLGTYFPISNNLLHSISLEFRNSVYTNEKIKIEGEVIKKNDIFKSLTIKILIHNSKINFVKGKAIIKII